MLSGTEFAKVEVEGARKLRRELRRAGRSLDDLKEAGRAAANIVAERARTLAPKGPSGNLSADIRAGNIATGGIVKTGRKRIPYAGPIHWGWLKVGANYSGGKYKPSQKRNIKPNPFLSNAATETERIWVPVYEKYLEKVLDDLKGKEI